MAIDDINDLLRQSDNTNQLREEPERNKEFWVSRISRSTQEERAWRYTARNYRQLYLQRLDKRPDMGNRVLPTIFSERTREMRKNIFYANTELLAAAILPLMPEPSITKRYGKQNAENTEEKIFFSTCADIVQRTIMNFVETDEILENFQGFKYDYLISGRGVLWAVYTDQKIDIKHVRITDFRMSGGRNWDEVTWIARRMIMTRKECAQEWGEETASKMEYTFPTAEDLEEKLVGQTELPPAMEVWEIWDKETKKVYWVSPGADEVLEEKDDPYHLDGFFPMPEPLRSIKDYYSLIPVPELNLYLTEAADLTLISKRIATLIEGIKGRSFYLKRFGDIVDTLQTSQDNDYIAIDMSAEVNDEGGLSNVFMFEPMQERVDVCAKLKEQKQDLENDIYDITGISDIIRGVENQDGTTPESASASVLKGRFGSLRLQARQQSFNRYLKALYSILAELICHFFTATTLAEITAIDLPDARTKRELEQKADAADAAEQQAQQEEDAKKAQAADKRKMTKAMNEGMPPPEPPMDDPMMGDPMGDPMMDEGMAPPPPEAPPEAEPLTEEEETMLKKPTIEEVVQYLRNNKLRSYLLNVETTMNVWDKGIKEQTTRNKIVQLVGDQLQNILPMLEDNLSMAKVYFKLVMFALEAYELPQSQRLELETTFAQVVEEMTAQLEQEQEPTPEEKAADAEMLKGEAEKIKANAQKKDVEVKAQVEMTRIQSEQEKTQTELQMEQLRAQIEQARLAVKQRELDIKEMEVQQEGQLRLQEIQGNLTMRGQEIQVKAQMANAKISTDAQLHSAKLQADSQIKKAESMRKSINDDNKSELERVKIGAEGDYDGTEV
jgi:hypothetical protein